MASVINIPFHIDTLTLRVSEDNPLETQRDSTTVKTKKQKECNFYAHLLKRQP